MHLFSLVIACMMTGFMAVFFTGWMQLLSQKEEIDTLGRKYLLSMETRGYCSETAIERMEEELQLLGCKDLEFTGTTMVPTEYGQEITLSVQGTLAKEIWGTELFETPFRIYLTSTAKN